MRHPQHTEEIDLMSSGINIIMKSQSAPGSDLSCASMNSHSIKRNDAVNDKALPTLHTVRTFQLTGTFS